MCQRGRRRNALYETRHRKCIHSTIPYDKTLFSAQGNIRNTEKLSYDRQQQYEIQVTAWDCGQKTALHSVPVRIDVKPVCKPGWQGGSLSL